MPSTPPSIRSPSILSISSSSSQKGNLSDDASDSKPTPTALPLPLPLDSEEVSEEERKAEKRLLWKLDLILLVWAWLAYVFKVSRVAAVGLSRRPKDEEVPF